MSNELNKWIDSIVQKVSDLPVHGTSGLMTVTEEELRKILEDSCEEINLTIE